MTALSPADRKVSRLCSLLRDELSCSPALFSPFPSLPSTEINDFALGFFCTEEEKEEEEEGKFILAPFARQTGQKLDMLKNDVIGKYIMYRRVNKGNNKLDQVEELSIID